MNVYQILKAYFRALPVSCVLLVLFTTSTPWLPGSAYSIFEYCGLSYAPLSYFTTACNVLFTIWCIITGGTAHAYLFNSACALPTAMHVYFFGIPDPFRFLVYDMHVNVVNGAWRSFPLLWFVLSTSIAIYFHRWSLRRLVHVGLVALCTVYFEALPATYLSVAIAVLLCSKQGVYLFDVDLIYICFYVVQLIICSSRAAYAHFGCALCTTFEASSQQAIQFLQSAESLCQLVSIEQVFFLSMWIGAKWYVSLLILNVSFGQFLSPSVLFLLDLPVWLMIMCSDHCDYNDQSMVAAYFACTAAPILAVVIFHFSFSCIYWSWTHSITSIFLNSSNWFSHPAVVHLCDLLRSSRFLSYSGTYTHIVWSMLPL